MKVETTARRLTVDAKTKETIEKRLEKLSRVLPREADALHSRTCAPERVGYRMPD